MSLDLTLGAVTGLLDDSGIPYMLTGSTASTIHGEPRSTQDIDLVVDPDRARLDDLIRRVPADRFYVSDVAAREALRHRSQFNLIDMETGWKVDLIVRKDRPFSVSEFGRRVTLRAFGLDLPVATAEDVVLAKLEWARKGGGSERQLRDVRGILGATHPLDLQYLRRWADELQVRDDLEALLLAS